MTTRILFDASSTNPISELIAVAPGDCLLINAYNLNVGESAQVFMALMEPGSIPATTQGSCFPPPSVTAAQIIVEEEFLPCGVPVQAAQSASENITSIVVSQPGFYRVHLTPAALGTAFVEAIVLSGADACERAQAVCCCSPETQWVGTSLNPCLQIIPGGQLGHQPAFNLDPCCLLQQLPAGGPPALTDSLIFLRGSTCFVSTVDETFAQMIVCDSLAEFPPGVVAVGDRLIALDVNDNCKALDIAATVTALETPWTGTSNNANLTIAPGGVNGHAPVFDYDLCADLQAFASCACEPSPGDSVPIIQGGNCVLATWPIVDICDQMGLLATGAYVVGDTLLARDIGGNCKQIVIFPLLPQDGTCAAPVYSFASSPNSGMWFDPAVGPSGAVVVSDHNCANRINVGASIELISTLSDVSLQAPAGSVSLASVGSSAILLNASGVLLSAPGGAQSIDLVSAGAINATAAGLLGITIAANGGALSLSAASNIGITSSAAAIIVTPATTLSLGSGGATRLTLTMVGEWSIAGSGVGTFGQHITSQGPGLPPTWQAAVVFPILAPNGSCLAPSYSFASSPDSGMFYTGSAVRIGDDNCTDFIEVGASITIQTAATPISLIAGAALTAAAQTFLSLTTATSFLSLSAATQLEFFTAALQRLVITALGEWMLGGTPGVAGQRVTSNGPGLAPTWQP